METYTVIKKGSQIKRCIQIPKEYLEKDLEITIRPHNPKQNISKKLDKLYNKYKKLTPFQSIKDPGAWQREARRDWE